VRLAKSFTPDMVQQASGDGSVRRVGPFEMRPGAGAGQPMQMKLLEGWHVLAKTWVVARLDCDMAINARLTVDW
jgi:hypothetical protein